MSGWESGSGVGATGGRTSGAEPGSGSGSGFGSGSVPGTGGEFTTRFLSIGFAPIAAEVACRGRNVGWIIVSRIRPQGKTNSPNLVD